ncbi:MAG: nickel pincer cofactor biosynthesis protein LarC [Lachnospiraceae bacterium]|nr:nickel pincer cofactor biosynthesis protein LarC [Lachnospiraceae bacterium]
MGKIVYLECNMGAAGDMLTAALYELLEEDARKEFCQIMSRKDLGICVAPEIMEKCGVQGTYMRVLVDGSEEMEIAHHLSHAHGKQGHSHKEHNHVQEEQGHIREEHNHVHGEQGHIQEERNHVHREQGYIQEEHSHHHGGHNHVQEEHSHHHGEHYHIQEEHHIHEKQNVHHGEHSHHHASLAEVYAMIESYPVSHAIQLAAKSVYEQIAAAESHAHGKPVSEIHFHEVGMKDAIADVVNVCWIIDKLAVDKIVVSDINVGYGEVHCAHGVLPVPAPATAFLLQGAPIYQGEIRGELCTPTGAALLQYIHTAFGRMPIMKIEKTGYGMGSKDFSQANCIRAFLGEEEAGIVERIVELSCNLDDMSGEEIGFACELLRKNGALDVYTESIGMKKNRPGVKLVCMCREDDIDRLRMLILKHTTTWGVRKAEYERYTLDCTSKTVETEYGPVRIKTGKGYGITKSKPEYEDLAEVAQREGIALKEVMRY